MADRSLILGIFSDAPYELAGTIVADYYRALGNGRPLWFTLRGAVSYYYTVIANNDVFHDLKFPVPVFDSDILPPLFLFASQLIDRDQVLIGWEKAKVSNGIIYQERNPRRISFGGQYSFYFEDGKINVGPVGGGVVVDAGQRLDLARWFDKCGLYYSIATNEFIENG